MFQECLLTMGSEYILQYIYTILLNHTLQTYWILLLNVTPIIFNNKKEKKILKNDLMYLDLQEAFIEQLFCA